MFICVKNISFDEHVENKTELEGDVSRGYGRNELRHSPSVLPSFPMMHFMARRICSVTGGDMAEAYTAL